MKQINNKIINNDFFKQCKKNLYKHYGNIITNKYNLIKINNILSNRKTRMVSIFKDYLLYDDISEFFKRYYKGKESFIRIKKLSKYYKDTSIIYPNYSSIKESKYLYSNIIKKQMVINKQENYIKKMKNNKIQKFYQDKVEEENINEIKFFNSTIYNDILNESESFMSLLFGIESINGNNEKDKNNISEKIKNDNNKEIQELTKIIDIIEKSENIRNKNENKINNIEGININKNYKKKPRIITVNNNLNRDDNNNKIINTNKKIFDAMNSKITKINKLKKGFNHVIKIEKNKKLLENDKNNEISKENNNYINSQEVKQYFPSHKKTIYHRKVNSTLIGDYLNKLELPSNSNFINMLKNANETYADNINKSSMRSIIYQSMKSTNGFELKNPLNKRIHFPKYTQINNKISEKNIKDSNLENTIENKTQPLIEQKIPISRNNPLNKFAKRIEVMKLYKKNNYLENQKGNSPSTTRNYTTIISLYENNKKSTNNGNTLNNLNSNEVSNSIFSTYKKPENGFKSLYVNPNFTGPYTKPKCIYKDKKFNGITGRKLFCNSNEHSNNEIENKN